ncbi:hypothetical protein [Micromonospora sp. C95]|uniref:hypothetical protein n=1 Tax=Micromonospora sp. C95 TaxID=2824882 RepID=UPI001B36D745|nr:hypothetical protein [Micromonospora sp. C95]MBQ1026542.1 hypothetical protein [Micromonospora sp. C95]
MTRRRRGLVRVVLRLGFLTVVAGAAWYAYDVTSTDVAQAAGEPPAAAQDAPAPRGPGLVRALLTPVLAADPPAPEPAAPPPPQAADPPAADPPDERSGRPAPAPPTGEAPPKPPAPTAPADPAPPGDKPAPPADAGPPAGGQPPQDTSPPPVPMPPVRPGPHPTYPATSIPASAEPVPPRAGPGRADQAPPAGRLVGSPVPSGPDDRSAEKAARLLGPLPEAVRDEVAAVVAAAGPLADPLLAVLEELLGSGSPPLEPIVVGLDPVLAPIGDLLEPVLDILEPGDGPPQPAPAPTPTDPTPQPDPDPTAPEAGVDPMLPGGPVRADPDPTNARLIRPGDQVIGQRYGGSSASLSRAMAATAADGEHDRDRQAERTPGQPPPPPAPGTSGAEQAPIPPNGPADTAAGAWSPPAVSSRLTRLPHTRHQPSRSPRPRSRPA